jgi:hypothetical protein
MMRIVVALCLVVTIAGTLLASTAIAAEPADTTRDDVSTDAILPAAYVVIGQVDKATIDAVALQRKRTTGALRAYDPSLGYLTGVVRGATQETGGAFKLTGRGRLRVGSDKPVAVRFVLTADPTSKAVSLELTKIDGGASAGKLSGTMANGLIKLGKPGAN